MRLAVFLAACLPLLLPGPALRGLSSPITVPLSHYYLKNGLQVVLSEDFTLPLVSVALVYKVGSLHDPPGKSGMAYLLENLMFLGSDNVGQMQHIGYVTRTGGTLNASTQEDRTLYYQTVPSNQLALVLWLESDRMKSLQITPAKVEAAKDELIAELQRRNAEGPYLESFFRFDRMLYGPPPASRPVIGLRDEIKSITVEDIRAFQRMHYAPQNALLCVTGNFNALQLRELVGRYFESIPRGPDPPPLASPAGFQMAMAAETVRAARIPSPGFLLGFRIYAPRPDDLFGLTLIDYLLCRGNSGRLVQRLVKRERLASQISGGLERRGQLSCYRIFVTNNSELMAQRCLDSLHAELARLRSSSISQAELDRAKNQWKQDMLSRLASRVEKALYLADLSLSQAEPQAVSLDLGRYQEVTPQLIAGLMNRYFTRENSLVLFIQK